MVSTSSPRVRHVLRLIHFFGDRRGPSLVVTWFARSKSSKTPEFADRKFQKKRSPVMLGGTSETTTPSPLVAYGLLHGFFLSSGGKTSRFGRRRRRNFFFTRMQRQTRNFVMVLILRRSRIVPFQLTQVESQSPRMCSVFSK